MESAATNAPMFLSALYDGIESLRASGRYDLPTIEDINDRCRTTQVGFELDPPNIIPHSAAVLRAFTNVTNAASKVLSEWRVIEEQAVVEVADRPFPNSFDVAITVAGPDREFARKLAERLQANGLDVFYDELFPEHLWVKICRTCLMTSSE